MTVQTNTNVASFNGNGVTQIFQIAFKFNNDTDLVVLLVDDDTGSASLLTLNSDYTVSGEGNEEGGLINVVVAPATGKRLKVTRVVDILQLTDLRNQGKFFAEIHEDALDLLTMIAQQHESGINSSLRVAESDPEPARIPAVAQRAGKILSFDANGNPQVVAPVTDSSTELRQELAAASGAGMVGYSGGVTVSEFLDALQSAALGEGADLIGYGSSDVKQALDDLQTIPANEILLVPSQFATIQDACAEVIKRRYDLNVNVEIRLETGYQIPSGVDIRNSDLRNVRVTSDDAVVTLAPGFTGVSLPSDKFGTGAIFYGENSHMLRLSCLIDAADTGGPGYYLNLNSTGYVSGGCGVINAGKFGLYIATSSEAIATNANFSGANWGNRVTVGSRLTAPQINCSGAKLQNYEGSNVVAAMDVSRGSIAYVTGTVDAKTNLTNSAGRGLAVRRSFVSATHVDVSGAALDGIRATTGAWIAANGASANNCLVDNVSCYASWIDGSDSLVATGAGRYGLLVQDGGKANCRGADFSGALGGRGVSVVMGGSATINGANCRQTSGVDSATDIFVSDGSIVHAAGATGGTNITVLTLNADGLIFK